MNKFFSKSLIKKDILDIVRSKTLIITLIIIPIIFSIIIPSLVVGGSLVYDMEKAAGKDMEKMINSFVSTAMGDSIAAYTTEQQIVYIFINFILPNLFLLVPIITAMTVSANSFVGEKERRTMESLLLSPISIRSLYFSKVIASFIPPFFVSLVSFLACGFLINFLGYPLFDELIFPSANWVVMILLLSPMVILLVVLINILISSRVKTYQEAQNIGGIIVLPVIGLLVGQVSGLFFVGVQLTITISIGILIINLILLNRISKHNDRFVLFEKQIH
ncbi:ABC transporter permease subunit [Bacillus massilinigeriensis]|uniref:ABC transporter permease subunit n=1 Tax=Bacillus massilionigeriensis TaxID=1805475 RepID=UPI00096B560A|nr:ABC transporter permease subunit [Bacillus massilionigeriensis]